MLDVRALQTGLILRLCKGGAAARCCCRPAAARPFCCMVFELMDLQNLQRLELNSTSVTLPAQISDD